MMIMYHCSEDRERVGGNDVMASVWLDRRERGGSISMVIIVIVMIVRQ